MLNIEIKAKVSDLDNIRSILVDKKAEFKGLDHQLDTYFKVKRGRLKLREGKIENNLIYYQRKNIKGPKKSDFLLFKTNAQESLKQILSNSLEVLVVVDKKREIYLIENVKFHLDTVNDLGDFFEIEVIDQNPSLGQKKLEKQCHFYLDLFNIKKKDLISFSYSELLLKKLN